MTVDDLSMECWRIISGGDISVDNGFSLVDYKEAIQQACAQIIRKECWDRYKLGDGWEVNSNYLEVYEGVQIQYNSVRNVYYAAIPNVILSLPKDYGVQYVGQNKSLDNPFTRLTFGTRNFYTKLPNDICSWILTEGNVEFTNFNPLITNIVMAIIPAKPTNINDDDATMIKDIVLKEMFQFLNVEQQKLNNNNPNQKDIVPQQEQRQR